MSKPSPSPLGNFYNIQNKNYVEVGFRMGRILVIFPLVSMK